MIKRTIGLIAMFLSTNVNASVIYEIVNTRFNSEIDYSQQQEAMESLNSVVSAFDGFQQRRFFYSKELNRWTDIVIWDSLPQAKQASEQAMANPIAQQAFSKMDMKETLFSHYHLVGSIDAE